MKKETAINSSAYAYLLSLIGKLEVISLMVQGKWLTAELGSGVRFSVKNKKVD